MIKSSKRRRGLIRDWQLQEEAKYFNNEEVKLQRQIREVNQKLREEDYAHQRDCAKRKEVKKFLAGLHGLEH